jgi:autotransporter-associated beta strand protein
MTFQEASHTKFASSLFIGMEVDTTGSGVPIYFETGTKITSISGGTIGLSKPLKANLSPAIGFTFKPPGATFVKYSNELTYPRADYAGSAVVVGSKVVGTGIPGNTFITGITGDTLLLNNKTTSAQSGVGLTITRGFFDGDLNITTVAGSAQATVNRGLEALLGITGLATIYDTSGVHSYNATIAKVPLDKTSKYVTIPAADTALIGGLFVGQKVTGSYIPTNTTIARIVDSQTIELSAIPTTTTAAGVTLTFTADDVNGAAINVINPTTNTITLSRAATRNATFNATAWLDTFKDNTDGFMGFSNADFGVGKLRLEIIHAISEGSFLDNIGFYSSTDSMLYWNAASPLGLTPSGGDGVWNGTSTNWLSKPAGGSPIAFIAGKSLSFGGSQAGTVNLQGASFDVGSIIFTPVTDPNAPSSRLFYKVGTVANDGIISLSGSSVIETQRQATIRAKIISAYEKTGLAELIVEGTNASAGLVKVTQGRLQVSGAAGEQNSNILNSSQLLIDKPNDWTYAFVLDGVGTMDKQGAGALIFSKNNTFTGLTTLTAGRIDIGVGLTEGALNSDIINGSLVRFNRSNDITYDKVISGSGAVTKLGAGVLTLLGVNTYLGLTTVSAGTLQIGNGAATGYGSAASVTGDIKLNGASTRLIYNNAGTKIAAGIISGTGAVIKRGTGTLKLTGTNSYDGVTTIETGRIDLANGSGLGSTVGNTVVNAGASLLLRDGFYSAENITIIGTGDASVGALVNVSDTNHLTGTVTLSGDATLSSGGGILDVQNVVGIGSKLTVLSTFTPLVNLAENAPLQLTKSVNLGSGRLEKTGEGSATLSGVANFTGGLYVLDGTLFAQGLTAFGQGTVVEVGQENIVDLPKLVIGVDTVFGGVVRLYEGEIAGPGTLTANSYDLRKGVVSANLLGSVGLSKSSPDEVILSGSNQYQGLTSVTGGILAIMNSEALGDLSSGTTVSVGGSLVFRKPGGSYGLSIAEEITIAGAANGGALRNDSGVNTITSQLKLSGDATIYAAGGSSKPSLKLAAVGDGSAHVLTVNAEAGASVYFSGGYDLGGGRLVKTGAGILELSSAGVINGLGQADSVAIEVLAGRVEAKHAQALGSGIVKVGNSLAGGILNIAVSTNLPSTLRLDNGLVSGVDLTALSYDLRNGAVSAALGTPTQGASVSVDKTSDGTVLLSGNNTYAGVTRIVGGALQVFSNGLGSAADPANDYTVVARSGALELAGNAVIANEKIYISGDGQGGFGALRTKGDARSVTISQTVTIDDLLDGLVNHARINNRDYGDTFTIGGLTGANKNAIFGRWESPAESDGRILINGSVSLGSGGLTVEGREQGYSYWYGYYYDTSSVRLTGIGTFSGGTDIRSGVVVAAHADAMGSGAITVGSSTRRGVFRTAAPLVGLGNITLVNGALEGETFRGPGNARFKYAINSPLVELQKGYVRVELAGTGAVTKTTGTTISLELANSYSGTTDVYGGILEMRNAMALGTDAAGTTVHDGATLKIARSKTVVASESLDLSGEGVGLIGALSSVGGGNYWNGGIQLSADARINAYSTLTLGGSSPLVGNGHAIKFGGTGTLDLQKQIQLGGAMIKDGAGTLIISADQNVASTDLIKGTISMVGKNVTSPTLTVRQGSTLSGYGRILGDVTVQSGAAAVLKPGTSVKNPTAQMKSLETNKLTFLDQARVQIQKLSNYLVSQDDVDAGRLDGPAPIVVHGDLAFLGAAKRVILTNTGGDVANGKYRLFEFTGNLTGNFSLGSSTPSAYMVGVKKGVRQMFAYDQEVDALSGRKFVTFTLGGSELVWRGTSSNQWNIVTNNWSLSDNLIPRVNVIQDDATVFDDRADGNTAIRVVPGTDGIKPVAKMRFNNTEHRGVGATGKEYTLYRDDVSTAVDLLQTESVTIGQGLPQAGKSWGVVNINTALKIIPDADGGDGNGLFLEGGTLRVGNNQALGGSLVELGGGRLTTFGADDRVISSAHVVKLRADDVIFGEAGHEGTLIFKGAIELDGQPTGIFNVDAAAGLRLDGGVIGDGIVKRGTGTLTLSGGDAYVGSVKVEAGVFELGNGGTAGAIESDVDLAGGEFRFNRGGGAHEAATTLLHAGDIIGPGRLRKVGTGRVSLTGEIQVGGGAFVDRGNLSVNGELTGNVTVANGGILSGSGVVNGNVVFGSGSSHEPGNSPGLATYNGNLSYTGGATIRWQLSDNVNSPGSAGTAYDLIVVNGNVDFSASANYLEMAFSGTGADGTAGLVNWSNPFWSLAQKWKVFQVSGTTSGLSTGLLLGGVPGSYQDINGTALSALHDEAYFKITQVGNDVWLNYIPFSAQVVSPLDLGVAYVGSPFNKGNVTIRNAGVNPVDVELRDLVVRGAGVNKGPFGVVVPAGSNNVMGVASGDADSSMQVEMNATNLGVVTGGIAVDFRENGGPVSITETLTVRGTAYELAAPRADAVDFGSIRISDPTKSYHSAVGLAHLRGSFAQQRVQVYNDANPTYGEAMNASLTAATGGLTVSSQVVQQVLGGTMNNDLWANLATPTTAGGINEQATLNTKSLKADERLPGLAQKPLAAQQVTFTGKAYYHAFGVITNAPSGLSYSFGTVRQGSPFRSESIEVMNDVGSGLYSETLGAYLVANDNLILVNGSVTGLAAGATNTLQPLTVTLSSSRPGPIAGTATLILGTEPVAGSGLRAQEIARVEYTVTGAVIGPAKIDDSKFSIGRVHENGSFVRKPLPIKNFSEAPGYTDNLDVDVITWDPALSLTGPLTIRDLVADQVNTSIQVKLEDQYTTARGIYTKTVTLEGTSKSTDGTLTTPLGLTSVEVEGIVYNGKSTWLGGTGAWTADSWGRWATTEGVPGLDGVLSTYDSATFAGNEASNRTVTLTGYDPELARLSFGGTNGTVLRSSVAEQIILGGQGLPEAAQINIGAGAHRIDTKLNLKQDLIIRIDGLRGLIAGTMQATDPQAKDIWLRGGGEIGFVSAVTGSGWDMNVTLQGPTLITQSQTFDNLLLESGAVISRHYLDGDPTQRVVTSTTAVKNTDGTVLLGTATQSDRSAAELIKFAGFTDLDVQAGNLYNNATVVGGIVVRSGAKLGGVGYSGRIQVDAGGTLAPGNSIGDITTTALNVAAGAKYQVEFNGDGADKVIVTPPGGAVVKGGIEVVFSPGSIDVATKEFTIIEHASLSHDITPDLSLDLDIEKNGVFFDANTAALFPSLTPFIRTEDDHTVLYFGLYRNLGLPRTISSVPNIMGRTQSMFVHSITGDPYARLLARGPSAARGLTQSSLLSSKDNLDEVVSGAQDNTWVDGYAQAIQANQGAGSWGYDYQLGGVSAGIDLIRDKDWVMGLAFGLSQSESKHEYNKDKTSSTAYDLGFYTATTGDDASVSFVAFYSQYALTHTRFVEMGITTKPATGKPDAFRAGLSLGYDNNVFKSAESRAYLRMGLGAGVAHRDAFTETGDEAIAMSFDAINLPYFQLDMGMGYTTNLFKGDKSWQLFGEGMISRHVVGGETTSAARFVKSVSAGSDIMVESPEYTYVQFQPTVGVSWREGLNSAEFKLFAEMRSGKTSPGASASYKVRF